MLLSTGMFVTYIQGNKVGLKLLSNLASDFLQCMIGTFFVTDTWKYFNILNYVKVLIVYIDEPSTFNALINKLYKAVHFVYNIGIHIVYKFPNFVYFIKIIKWLNIIITCMAIMTSYRIATLSNKEA